MIKKTFKEYLKNATAWTINLGWVGGSPTLDGSGQITRKVFAGYPPSYPYVASSAQLDMLDALDKLKLRNK